MPSHRLVKLWLLTLLAFETVSCAMGGPMFGPVDKSLVEIRHGITKALPIKINFASKDSREYKSVPFVRYGKKIKEAGSELQRAFAEIYIRGAERPYTIEVVVVVEEAQSPLAIQKDFRTVGYDERIAKIILARLKAHLNKRRDDSNLVDDFKVF